MADAIEPTAVYTLKKASELLHLPESTFRLLLKRGEIKGTKVGRQWRFLGDDILALLQGKEEAEDRNEQMAMQI